MERPRMGHRGRPIAVAGGQPLERQVPERAMSYAAASRTFDEAIATYSPEEAMREARRILAAGFDLEIASEACPLKVAVRGFIERIAAGDPDGALAVIRRAHPFPSVFGRMCHVWCERGAPALDAPGVLSTAQYPEADPRPDAPRPRIDRPGIRALERFAGDYGDPDLSPLRPERPLSGKRVAVVGSGSAGLAGAWMLRRLGHEVDTYDQLPLPGGTLISGYPPFRMARFAVRRDNDPAAWGARFFGGELITRERLEAIVEHFDLTLATIGKYFPYMVGIPGEDAEGVWNALDFIGAVGIGRPPQGVRRALVIGAGGTARDGCRTARRLGAEVTVCYRRSLDEIDIGGDPDILDIIMGEGISFLCQVQPVRVLADASGRVCGAEFVRTRHGPPDEAGGRPTMLPIPGTEFVVQCDTVIEAVGEGAGLSMLPESIAVEDGKVVVDRADHRTTHPKVFAAGELIGDLGNEGAALGAIQAALTMDSILRAEPLLLFDSRPLARIPNLARRKRQRPQDRLG